MEVLPVEIHGIDIIVIERPSMLKIIIKMINLSTRIGVGNLIKKFLMRGDDFPLKAVRLTSFLRTKSSRLF